jgi:hypothetical protein
MFIYKNWKNYRVLKYYLFPVWMNCVTWEIGEPQIYRWLIFGWTK